MIWKIVYFEKNKSFSLDLGRSIPVPGGNDPFGEILSKSLAVSCVLFPHFFRACEMQSDFRVETHYWGHLMSTCFGEPGDWLIFDLVTKDVNICLAENFSANYQILH